MQLRSYQQSLKNDIYDGWAAGQRNMLAVSATGSGKCLGKGTPVLMYNGEIKPVENVLPGDLLMGPDSKPRVVETTCSGYEPLYKVIPTKGDPYIVNESHILSLKTTGFKKVKPGGIVNIPLTEYINSHKTFKHYHKGWRVGVDWVNQCDDTFLPPYLLGLWLGDGTSRSASITTMDVEIIEFLYSFAEMTGQQIRVELQNINNKSSVYHITRNWERKQSFRCSLRDKGLLNNKHIPLEYKTLNRRGRLELLAGLIDSDGSLTGNNGFDIIQKNKELAKDICFVARSLGLAAYIKRCVKKCGNNGVENYYFRISISGDTNDIPVKIQRKKAIQRIQKKSHLVTGLKIEKLKVGQYFGFELSGADRLFLLGDFTVTHNTVLFGSVIHDHDGPSCAIAHRQELVSQISMALAREQLRHRIIGPQNVIRDIVQAQTRELGRSWYDPTAPAAVAGVDTILKRTDALKNWMNSVTLWVQDEAHHLLRKNKWGRAIDLFPNAKGLGVTATPCRADGAGLGRHADGVFDQMVEGPGMRWLIDQGYLTDYRIFAPPSDLIMDDNDVGGSGDYTGPKMRAAAQKSHIIGDVVAHYLRIAPGKRGVTFATDVETATEMAARFNDAGVPAAVVHAKSKNREQIVRDFKIGKYLMLVNVDIFGEGFDLPAIDVVIMARPTMSYSLYAQQFGRALRILDGKLVAIIIDHVGNVMRHGLPDRHRIWTLDRREKRGKNKDPDVLPTRTCQECLAVYEAIYVACPYCHHVNEPAGRSRPEQVDGDLLELDPATLATMRGEIDRIDESHLELKKRMEYAGAPRQAVNGAVANHRDRQDAQRTLRDTIAMWAGYQRQAGRPDSESYRRFYFRYGVDVATAQTLGKKDANLLCQRIAEDLLSCNSL